METLDVPVLLRGVGVGKDLVQVILCKEILYGLGNETAVVVITNLNPEVAIEAIVGLQMGAYHPLPYPLDDVLLYLIRHLPGQHGPSEGVDNRQHEGVPAVLGHPNKLDVHLQHMQWAQWQHLSVPDKGSSNFLYPILKQEVFPH